MSNRVRWSWWKSESSDLFLCIHPYFQLNGQNPGWPNTRRIYYSFRGTSKMPQTKILSHDKCQRNTIPTRYAGFSMLLNNSGHSGMAALVGTAVIDGRGFWPGGVCTLGFCLGGFNWGWWIVTVHPLAGINFLAVLGMSTKAAHLIAQYRAITSQRGSAWHCYKGRLNSKGKMRFSTSRAGKANEYWNQTWQAWLCRWDQIWCRSVAK